MVAALLSATTGCALEQALYAMMSSRYTDAGHPLDQQRELSERAEKWNSYEAEQALHPRLAEPSE